MTFENLEVATPTGRTMLSEQHVEIAQGERVVIVGASGTGKTVLFRAIAGLWPWGSGRAALPSTDGMMFVLRQPYVPLGTLRAALAYPSPETAFKDEELAAMLRRAGLARLSSSLNRIARWDKELSDEEQQCLVPGEPPTRPRRRLLGVWNIHVPQKGSTPRRCSSHRVCRSNSPSYLSNSARASNRLVF